MSADTVAINLGIEQRPSVDDAQHTVGCPGCARRLEKKPQSPPTTTIARRRKEKKMNER
jgi:hypothetical protein